MPDGDRFPKNMLASKYYRVIAERNYSHMQSKDIGACVNSRETFKSIILSLSVTPHLRSDIFTEYTYMLSSISVAVFEVIEPGHPVGGFLTVELLTVDFAFTFWV